MARRAPKGKRAAPRAVRPARPQQPDSDDAESYSSDAGAPAGPRVFDDTDEEPDGLEGPDEEIDSDEAFGEDEEEPDIAPKRAPKDQEEDEEEEEEDDGEMVDLSAMLDRAPDDEEEGEEGDDASGDDAESDVSLDDDLGALLTQRGKRAAPEDAPAAKRSRPAERTEAVPESADAAAGYTGKLQLEDLLRPLDRESSLARVPSQVKALAESRTPHGQQPAASKRGGGALRAPLPTAAQERLDRQAAYALSKEEAEGWAPTIKRLREAEHLAFPLQKPAQPPAPSTAGLTASFKPTNDLERSVAGVLEDGGLSERQIAQQEDLALKQVDPEEAARRRLELRRMRELMFRAEQKAKRAKKIKSKTYRRVHRKERERLKQQQAELNPDLEDEEEQTLKAERDRAKERATLRHKNTGKWAKATLGRHGDSATEARQALEEQLLRGEQLRQKIHATESDDEVSDEYEPEGDEDDRAAAFNELDDFAERERAHDDAVEDEINAAGKSGRVFQMKFMKDARDRRARDMRAEIDALRDDVAQAQDDEDAEEHEDEPVPVMAAGRNSGRAVYGTGTIRTDSQVPVRAAAAQHEPEAPREPPAPAPAPAAPKAPKAPKAPQARPSAEETNPWLALQAPGSATRQSKGAIASKDSGAATRATHRQERHAARGAEARSAAQDDATLEISPSAQLQRREEASGEGSSDEEHDPVEVVPGTRKARGRRGKRGKGGAPAMQQRELVAEAFAGDDVAADFAREKRAAVNADAPREEDTSLPGWGAWGGKGARHKPRNPALVHRTAGLDPEKRKDRAMDNVIINERLDKKAAKFKAKDLPYPYTSAAQYEAAMRQPLGAEWNTRTQHQRLVLPRVTTKMGQRIDPIRTYACSSSSVLTMAERKFHR